MQDFALHRCRLSFFCLVEDMYQRKIRLEATWTFRGMASTGTHFGNGNRGVQAETIRDSHFYFKPTSLRYQSQMLLKVS